MIWLGQRSLTGHSTRGILVAGWNWYNNLIVMIWGWNIIVVLKGWLSYFFSSTLYMPNWLLKFFFMEDTYLPWPLRTTLHVINDYEIGFLLRYHRSHISLVPDSLRWRHNDHAGVSNHQPHDCLLNRLFRRKSKKTSKLRVTGVCAGNSPGTGEFPAQMASYAENVSIWWRHHVMSVTGIIIYTTRKDTIVYCCPDSWQTWFDDHQTHVVRWV